MKKHRLSLAVFVLFLASSALITACQETASRFTDRTIQNLEDEVGGAAERSSERAADQAGGAICGSNLALILLFAGAPAFFVLRRPGSTFHRRGKHRISSLFNQKIREGKRQKEEKNDRH
jgi:predicted small secreted protein